MMSTSEQQLSLPDDLTAPQTKLVYVTLQSVGEATASDLQDLLGLSKLSLMPVLTSLVANDYIVRTEDGYACY
ncbi:hypothetical protein C493_16584 [Natronolimnohabitans innermongolicus JCM 12255]|uniref:Transcription regulator TrmB N-terminal domain-containing protein n=1 Tax=Natronolimnohabitans innermongolicus JCM 12255 TaxID=1227499 RepID=L9WRR8_9EURY|nr:MarR family winged helix-turn-helix transcriptional regulator [Natronolimnohabitans innermongolicus]ELY52112.1 hypothetical protein C493_16584 [Natronolimnohabitans innermongolicus JCM 12255]